MENTEYFRVRVCDSERISFSFINIKGSLSFFYFFSQGIEEEEEENKGLVISSEACLTDITVGKVGIERREQLSCSLILYFAKTCLSTGSRETGPTGSECVRNGAVYIIKVNVSQWKRNT